MPPRLPVPQPEPGGCPVCGARRLALVALPGAGPTGERVCLACGALWRPSA